MAPTNHSTNQPGEPFDPPSPWPLPGGEDANDNTDNNDENGDSGDEDDGSAKGSEAEGVDQGQDRPADFWHWYTAPRSRRIMERSKDEIRLWSG
ncbi:hypothetical protein N7475_001075 [Penicillium sp. IBT 31633x]|nr:hypothetical protein N7475_001075 [Penicillium sp. IBT 31633x]